MNIFRCLFLIAISLFLAPTFCLGQDSGFDGLDTDSDGKVTKKEFQEYAEGKLPDTDQLDKFADMVDADKDGEISEDEFDGRMEKLQSLNQTPDDSDKEEKKEKTEEETKRIDEATKAYDALAKLVSKGDWEKATKSMTKQASDDYAVGMVTQSLSLTQMALPPQMDNEAVNDAKEATEKVLKKYKLNDIDLSSLLKNRNPKGGDDKDSDDTEMTPQEKAKAKREETKAMQVKLKAEIMAAIDKDEKRWEIVDALRSAQEEISFNRDVLAGKVGDSDADKNTVFLTVTQDANVGQIAIPIVAKMKAEKGKWKYTGIDSSRTQKAMQKMMKRLRSGAKPADPDTDF